MVLILFLDLSYELQPLRVVCIGRYPAARSSVWPAGAEYSTAPSLASYRAVEPVGSHRIGNNVSDGKSRFAGAGSAGRRAEASGKRW